MSILTRFSLSLICLSLIPQLVGCQASPDFVLLEQQIRDLHRAGIQAHLDGNVDFFTENISDQYFSVGKGEITHPARAEIAANFSDYLNSTTFSKYEDLREPIVGFSADGSLAWCIVQVEVAGERRTEAGPPRELHFTCAWITLYQSQENTWIRLGDVSTFQ